MSRKSSQTTPVDSVRSSHPKSSSGKSQIRKFSAHQAGSVLTLQEVAAPQSSKSKSPKRSHPRAIQATKSQPESFTSLVIKKSLQAPVGIDFLVAGLCKSIVSWKFIFLISLPLILANFYWSINVNLHDLTSTFRHWLNPIHYPLIVGAGAIILVVLLLSFGLQAQLFPASVRRILSNQKGSALILVKTKFWRQILILLLELVTWASVIAGVLAVGASLVPNIHDLLTISAQLQLLGLIVIALTLLLLVTHGYELVQLIVVEADVGIGKALVRAIRLSFAHPLGWLGAIMLKLIRWILTLAVLVGSSVVTYWALVNFPSRFYPQTLIIFAVVGVAVIIFTWQELFVWQTAAHFYQWLQSRLKPEQKGLLQKIASKPPGLSWSAPCYVLIACLVVMTYGAIVYQQRTNAKAGMAWLQQHLPDDSQRLIPSSRNIRYNIR